MTNQGGIYQIRNTTNGKIYVGSAKCFGVRWRAHRNALKRGDHHSRKLQNAWNKYGQKAFAFEIMFICAAEDLVFYEQRALDAMQPHKFGYNISAGAEAYSRKKNTDEHNRRISESHRGLTYSDEYKQKLSRIHKSRRRGKRLTYNGRTQTTVEWASELGLRYNVFQHRLRQWGSLEAVHTQQAMTRNEILEKGRLVRQRNTKKYTVNGETKTLLQWAKTLGLNKKTLSNRISRGWSLEDAITRPLHARRNNGSD